MDSETFRKVENVVKFNLSDTLFRLKSDPYYKEFMKLKKKDELLRESGYI